MNTTEKNILIADFMGLKPVEVFGRWGISKNHVSVNCKTEAEAFESFCKNTKYHSDWGWLMEVVEKIENLGFDFAIYTGSSVSIINTKNFPFKEVISEGNKNKIDAVYNACIEFIKWYNQQKK